MPRESVSGRFEGETDRRAAPEILLGVTASRLVRPLDSLLVRKESDHLAGTNEHGRLRLERRRSDNDDVLVAADEALDVRISGNREAAQWAKQELGG